MTEQVIDAEVVEETTVTDTAASPVEGTRSTALEVRPASREVLMPMDTEQVVAGMAAYQDLLPKLLKPSDWQQAGKKKFVKKSGWRKIARAFNLSVTKVSLIVERDETGNPLRAEAVFRATAPNGQTQDGDGYCSVDEKRFREQATDSAKTENDLRATATTRAKNRAISDLVGMGEVSAEEVDAGAGAGSAPAASKQQLDVLAKALNYLLPPEVSTATWDRIKELCGGEITGQAALAVLATIAAKKNLDSQDPDQTQTSPTDPPLPAESGPADASGSDQAPATEEPEERGDLREELEASK